MGLPCSSVGKESACNVGDLGLIPGLGRSPGEGKGYPLQYSGLENSMDCIVHRVAKSWTRLSELSLLFMYLFINLSFVDSYFFPLGFHYCLSLSLSIYIYIYICIYIYMYVYIYIFLVLKLSPIWLMEVPSSRLYSLLSCLLIFLNSLFSDTPSNATVTFYTPYPNLSLYEKILR